MVFSQSSNIGIPDYSKIISIDWHGNRSGIGTGDYVSLPDLVNLNNTQSTYVIPNDGWIIWTEKEVRYNPNGERGDDVCDISYFINGAQTYGGAPIPVRKGDVISAYNSCWQDVSDAAMKFAPNR